MNNKTPKVSIVIPVYNGSKYVKEAIDSALNQTYKNIEIIVINDGSNDHGKTRKVVLSYGNKVKYYEKKNGGVSTALNLAISKMTGEYFSWLSHDDRYYPNKIESQIDYLKDFDDNTILYSDYDLMDSYSNVFASSIKDHEELVNKPEYALLRGAINGITLLIPKKAFEDCGIFDENLRCVQDYDLWLKMMKKYKFVHQSKILGTTRLHDKQTGNTSPRMLSEGNPFWIDLIESFSDNVKIKLDGSVYGYYKNMVNFLESTPYNEALDYCKNKCEVIKNNLSIHNDLLVSIIIPFYEGNTFQEVIRAIKSVENQTYKNIEIIVVNDGAKKNVINILKYIKGKKNIVFIETKKNCGVSNARNLAIEKARGSYISFLDSDDEFLKDKIKIQLEEMVLTNSLVSHTSYYRINAGEKQIINSGQQTGKAIPMLLKSCLIATPTVMIKKDYLIKNKFRFDIELKYGEDTCFWLTILKNKDLLGIDIPLSIVHTDDESAAYNLHKQILGVKSIIQFILNDNELSKYDKQIASLSSYYVNLVYSADPDNNKELLGYYQNEYLKITRSLSWRITYPLRFTKKCLKALIKKGPIYCFKRLINKIRGK